MLGGQLLKDRADLLARAAPLSKKVDEDQARSRLLQHLSQVLQRQRGGADQSSRGSRRDRLADYAESRLPIFEKAHV